MELTANDFFCGAGGMGLAFKQAGYVISGAWDIDKYSIETYRHNVEKLAQQVDIKDMTWKDVPQATVWTFGFPCQDLSVAGKQTGLFKGARSGLFFEIIRLLKTTAENDATRMPQVILAENVKGLRPYIPVLEEEFKRAGYTTHIKLYNSKYHDVAQSRERYYIVGTRSDIPGTFAFSEEQTEFVPRLSDFLDKNPSEKYYLSDDQARKIIEQALDRLDTLGKCHAALTPDRIDKRQNGRRAKENEEPMFTLTAQDLHGVIVGDYTESHRVRKLTPTEYGRLQAFPVDDWWEQVVSDSQAYKQYGNAVTVTVARTVAQAIKGYLEKTNGVAEDCKSNERNAESELSLFSTEELLKELMGRNAS